MICWIVLFDDHLNARAFASFSQWTIYAFFCLNIDFNIYRRIEIKECVDYTHCAACEFLNFCDFEQSRNIFASIDLKLFVEFNWWWCRMIIDCFFIFEKTFHDRFNLFFSFRISIRIESFSAFFFISKIRFTQSTR